MKRNGKYNARKISNANGKFDSKLEMYRYYFLRDAENQGIISDLRTQVPFEIIPHQTITITETTKTGKIKTFEKIIERATLYVADFVYVKDGVTIIEDTKSEATRKKESYIIKRKLMRLQGHPIKEVLRSTEEI